MAIFGCDLPGLGSKPASTGVIGYFASNMLLSNDLYNKLKSGAREKRITGTARRGIGYALIRIMFFIIISGALTLSSAVTLAFLALRAPEAYETEHGLQVVHRIPKQRDSNQLSEALVQAR